MQKTNTTNKPHLDLSYSLLTTSSSLLVHTCFARFLALVVMKTDQKTVMAQSL